MAEATCKTKQAGALFSQHRDTAAGLSLGPLKARPLRSKSPSAGAASVASVRGAGRAPQEPRRTRRRLKGEQRGGLLHVLVRSTDHLRRLEQALQREVGGQGVVAGREPQHRRG